MRVSTKPITKQHDAKLKHSPNINYQHYSFTNSLNSKCLRYLEVIRQLLSSSITRVHGNKHCTRWIQNKICSFKDELFFPISNSLLNRVNLLCYHRQHLQRPTWRSKLQLLIKKKEKHNPKLKNELFTSSSILLNSSKQAQAPA